MFYGLTQIGTRLRFPAFVSCRRFPPSTFTAQTSASPLLMDTKAICDPSGDQAGSRFPKPPSGRTVRASPLIGSMIRILTSLNASRLHCLQLDSEDMEMTSANQRLSGDHRGGWRQAYQNILIDEGSSHQHS